MELPNDIVRNSDDVIDVLCECRLRDEIRTARVFGFTASAWISSDEARLKGHLQSILREEFSEPEIFLIRFKAENYSQAEHG